MVCVKFSASHMKVQGNGKGIFGVYRIAGIFRGYKFSRMDHYKGFRGFYFRGLSSSLLAHAHINMQLLPPHR